MPAWIQDTESEWKGILMLINDHVSLYHMQGCMVIIHVQVDCNMCVEL